MTAAGGELPAHCYASDLDAFRWFIATEPDADLAGWALRVRTSSGCLDEARFTRLTLWGSCERFNVLGLGPQAERWAAPCEHGDEAIELIPPRS